MLLLAPTEISSITIYLLSAVSVKGLYLIGKRDKTLPPKRRLWRRAQGRVKEIRDKANTTVNSESSS